jgi:hypothetical protein
VKTELELWKQSRVRYERIGELIDLLINGIKDCGSKELKIPSCGFCNANFQRKYDSCEDCEWGAKFGVCGEDKKSEWMKSNNLLEKASRQNSKTIKGIKAEIERLEKAQEVTL